VVHIGCFFLSHDALHCSVLSCCRLNIKAWSPLALSLSPRVALCTSFMRRSFVYPAKSPLGIGLIES